MVKKAENDPSPADSDDRTRQLLLDFLSGRLLGDIGISHEETISALKTIDDALDASKGKESLGHFVKDFGEKLAQMESESIRNYGKRLIDLSRNEMKPTREAVQAIMKTFEDAQANKTERDPEKRKSIAAALRKVPAGIDFVISELHEIARDFQSLEQQFSAESDYIKEMKAGRTPQEDLENQEYLQSKLPEIHAAIFNREAPLLLFQSQQLQIKKRAQMLEKEFMNPPREPRIAGLG